MSENYPRYYDVDGVPVKVFVDPKTGYVAALNDLGNPADLAVSQLEGHKITEAEFKRMSADRTKVPQK